MSGPPYHCEICGVGVTKHDHVAMVIPVPTGLGLVTVEGYVCDTHLAEIRENITQMVGHEPTTAHFGEGRNPDGGGQP